MTPDGYDCPPKRTAGKVRVRFTGVQRGSYPFTDDPTDTDDYTALAQAARALLDAADGAIAVIEATALACQSRPIDPNVLPPGSADKYHALHAAAAALRALLDQAEQG